MENTHEFRYHKNSSDIKALICFFIAIFFAYVQTISEHPAFNTIFHVIVVLFVIVSFILAFLHSSMGVAVFDEDCVVIRANGKEVKIRYDEISGIHLNMREGAWSIWSSNKTIIAITYPRFIGRRPRLTQLMTALDNCVKDKTGKSVMW